MSTYSCATRTNYFRVNNETVYDELVKGLTSSIEGSVNNFVKVDDNGCIWHGFGAIGEIHYTKEEKDLAEVDMDMFFKKLQTILPDDEAVIVYEAGNESLRYVVGYATIVTSKEIRYISLDVIAKEAAGKMLGLSDSFQTQDMY